MKPLATIALSVVLSVALAVGACLVWLDGRPDGDRLVGGEDPNVKIARVMERLDRIAEDQAALQARIDQSLASPDTEGIRRMRSSLELEIAGMREELAQLAKEMDERPLRVARGGAAMPDLSDEETAAALAAYVEEKVEEQVRKNQNPARQFAPMIKMNMSRQIRRTADKLGLDEVQTKRLTEASTAAFDKALPAVEIMMDPKADVAAKERALADVQVTMDEVSSEAASYMTSEQHTQFLEEQQRQMEQMDRMRAMWGGSGAPAGPAPGRSRTTGGGN